MMQHHYSGLRLVHGLLFIVSLWLLSGCGQDDSDEASPRATSSENVWFEDVTNPRGVDFIHRSGHQEAYLIPEIMVGGVAVFDMEGDGDLDLYLVQSGSIVDGRCSVVVRSIRISTSVYDRSSTASVVLTGKRVVLCTEWIRTT